MSTDMIFRFRPEPHGRILGSGVPGLIHNGNYYFTELGVYADGIVDCWGGVDLNFLTRKLEAGWISPAVPVGATLVVHDLIQAQVLSGQWSHDNHSLHERLVGSVRQLNPSMQNLMDFEGEDVELRNGVRYAKVGLIRAQPCRRELGERSPPASRATPSSVKAGASASPRSASTLTARSTFIPITAKRD